MKISWPHLQKRNPKHVAYYPINAERDWLIMLITFLVFVSAGVAYEAYIFLQNNTTTSVLQTPASLVDDMKDPEPKDPLLPYKIKAAEFEKAKASGPDLIDPAR